MFLLKSSFIYFVLVLMSFKANAQEFENLNNYLNGARYFQCEEFQSEDSKERIKVAILEESFGKDLEERRGESLPEDFTLVFEQEHKEGEFHGEYVAELFTAFVTKDGSCKNNAPKVFLIPTQGYTGFKRAVDKAIELDVDIVLFNSVYEYLGNGDASDFLNQYVNKATDHGIFWVNAVGNFQGKVYQSKVTKAHETLTFNNNASKYRDDENLYFTCKPHSEETCKLIASLTWNSFSENENQGTNKDLNFGLFDEIGKNIETSAVLQTTDEKQLEENPRGTSLYAYERIETQLQPGEYSFRVRSGEGDWSEDDFFRLAVEGNGIQWLSKSRDANTLYPPADNPDVVSVGAFDSELSSDVPNVKPNVELVSSIFSNGDEFRGSSISATLYAAEASLIMKRFPDKTNNEVYLLIKNRFELPCNFPVRASMVSEELQALSETVGIKVMPSLEGLNLLLPQGVNPYALLEIPYEAGHFLGYTKENGFESVSGRYLDSFVEEEGGLIVSTNNLKYKECKQ